jgi:predicted KAP-like P-loop ATPase
LDENGVYNYDSSKIKQAHFDCQNKCAVKMRNNVSRIVVANTFTEEWEMEPYYEIAKMYNYRVHTVIVENRHGNENIHNVPLDNLNEMKSRFKIKL